MLCTNCGKENDEGSKFCMFCGSLLAQPEIPVEQPAAQAGEAASVAEQPILQTEESLPAAGESPVTQSEPVITPQPVAAKVQPMTDVSKPPDSGKRTSRFKKLGIIFLGVVLLGIVVSIFWSQYRRIIALFQKETLFYVVQDHRPDEPFDSIMSINRDGKSSRELASESGGLTPPLIITKMVNSIFAPDRKHFAMYGTDKNLYQLHIYSTDGNESVLENDQTNVPGPDTGFSPDGRYFAYTTLDQQDNEQTTHVVNLDGDEVISVDGAIFGAFMPDSNTVAVIEVDSGNRLASAITLVDINNDETNTLVDIDEDTFTNPESVRPFPAPDGKSLYYMQGNELLSASLDEGSPTSVYEFEDPRSSAFFAPDGKNLVLLDYDTESNLMDLVILDPKSGDELRIDKYVVTFPNYSYIYLYRALYGDSPIKFSPDKKSIAYMVSKSGSSDLYVSDLKRENRNKIASNAGWFTFDFSPDNRHIVYIESNDPSMAGDLYVSDYNGENRRRLDTDVWSFKILNDGYTVVYSKVSDLEQDRPESEMYSIRIDGEKQKQIMNADNGLFTFIQ